jgi:tetratricopeptide (TPR) repeat protein
VPARIVCTILLALLVTGAGLASATSAQDAPGSSGSTAALSAAPSLANAERMYRTGRFDEAAQEYAALAAGPQSALAYVGLARVDLKQKRPADGYAAATRALELAPNSPDAQVALGEVYFRQGRIPDAETIFVTVINSGANNARAFLGLARVSNAASFYRRGKEMIDRAHGIDPSDPDITRSWLATLPLAERIKALQDYLAQKTNDDAESRAALEHELVLLQQLPNAPTHQCRMVSKVSSTQTDLRNLLIDPNHLRGFGLDVKLNGISSHLMLDTGAGGILVDRKVADRAGIKQIVESDIRGIGDRGPAGGYVGYADSIQIGDLEFRDCNVRVMDRGSVAGEDGLIGADVFSHFLVDIDLSNAKFRLSELPPRPDEPAPEATLEAGVSSPVLRFHDRYIAPEMQSYTRILRFGHMLLIPTKLNDSISKLFLIDTGSLTNTISPDAAREVTKVSGDSQTEVHGLNGSVKNVFRGNELTLTFGNLRQKNLDIIAFDTKGMSDSAGTEISGILGFMVLRMLDVKIDYRDGLVSFNFDSKRWR